MEGCAGSTGTRLRRAALILAQSSVGVARQYCDQLGKKANCQAAVFAAYQGRRSAALVDRRLYLSQAWVSGRAMRRGADRPACPPARRAYLFRQYAVSLHY